MSPCVCACVCVCLGPLTPDFLYRLSTSLPTPNPLSGKRSVPSEEPLNSRLHLTPLSPSSTPSPSPLSFSLLFFRHTVRTGTRLGGVRGRPTVGENLSQKGRCFVPRSVHPRLQGRRGTIPELRCLGLGDSETLAFESLLPHQPKDQYRVRGPGKERG